MFGRIFDRGRGRGYLISFSIFCVCIIVGMVVYEMNMVLEEYIEKRVEDEVEANRVWLAEYIVDETYENSEEWIRGFREYCLKERLSCGIVNETVVVKSEHVYSLG